MNPDQNPNQRPQNLQYSRQNYSPNQDRLYGKSAPPPTQRDFGKIIKYGIIAGVLGLLLLGVFVFLSGTAGTDFASRTKDWSNLSNRDFGVRLRYPQKWNLNTGTQELVELFVNEGENTKPQLTIEVIPNPDWLEINEWLPLLDTKGLENKDEVQFAGRTAVKYDTSQNGTVYFVNSGPRIFRVSSFDTSQDTIDVLETLSIDAIAQTRETDENKGALIDFSPDAFKILFDETVLADTRSIDNRPAIYGDAEADAKIQSLAETRGYLLRSEYTGETSSINGFAVANQLKADWTALEKEAKGAGHDLDVTSGLRDIEDQRDIFKGRLTAACANERGSDCSLDDIKNGSVDSIIDTVLKTTSIPGYSRHHSGYTIDIQHTGQGALERFARTDGYRWLSEDNFTNAKRFGFIPSYPEGVERQGPDPEPWEYVWVGQDFLRNFE